MDEVVFSDKYQLLFDTIRSWDELEHLLAKKRPTKEELELIEYFEELASVHTVLCSGGRDSGKTFTITLSEVVAAVNYGHSVLSTRYTMSSTDMSITKAIEERIQLMRYESYFNYKSNEYTCKHNKGRIDVTGQKTSSGNQTAKLKSLENYSIFITDEGEEMPSFDEWNKVKRSMRRKDVQCLSIVSFNPPTDAHWLYHKFYKNIPEGFCGVKDGVLYIHTTYLDNGKENMAEHNWNEYEALRKDYEWYRSCSEDERLLLPKKIKINHDEYKFAVLGSFKKRADNVVYENWEIGEFKHTGVTGYGLDFGSNDPDALTKVSIDFREKRIYIKQEYFKNETSSTQLRDVLEKVCGFDALIVADTSGRRLIREYWQYGLNIKRASKRDKADQIKILQSWVLVVDPNSPDLIDSFNNYKYHDKKAGVIEEGVNLGVGVKHYFSDLMDSWRYIAWDILKSSYKSN